MKTAFWQASSTASKDGENSQTNGLEHTIESSILTDLIFRKSAEEELRNGTTKNHLQTSKKVQFNQCISKFKSTQQLHQFQHITSTSTVS
jgi:hypothetical protein